MNWETFEEFIFKLNPFKYCGCCSELMVGNESFCRRCFKEKALETIELDMRFCKEHEDAWRKANYIGKVTRVSSDECVSCVMRRKVNG